MVRMLHYDDCKEERQSHEIYFQLSGDDDFKNFFGAEGDGHVTELSLASLRAYGATKEEALKNMEPIMEWLAAEIQAIYLLYQDGFYDKNVIDVDASGIPIGEE